MRNFWQTWVAATLHPGKFFAEPAATRSRMPPVLFAAIIGALASAVSMTVELAIAKATLAALAGAFGVGLVLGASSVLLGVVVESAIVHGLLRLFGGATQPFSATFNACCHAAAPQLFGVVPIAGQLIGGVWRMVATVLAIKRTHGTGAGRALVAVLTAPLLAVVVALSLRAWVVEAFRIPAGSMIPTLQVGDHLFVNKMSYQLRGPERGEVAVFVYPLDPSKDFIKRIVAVGGDTVEMRDGRFILNGVDVPHKRVDGDCTYWDFAEAYERWQESHCAAWTETLDGHPYTVYTDPDRTPHDFERVTVPPHHVYVLGDNRDNSSDSRIWGFVPEGNLKGPAKLIWYSSGGPDGAIRMERLGKRVR